MLRLLSGREHQVLTGIWTISAGGRETGKIVRSRVRFCALSDREIPALTRRMGSLDKAGAYTAEGRSSPVLRVEGPFSNVLGFPLAEVGRFLAGLPLPS